MSDKVALTAAETPAVRQLTYFAAREKYAGRCFDLEAGMAKRLTAGVAANRKSCRDSSKSHCKTIGRISLKASFPVDNKQGFDHLIS